MFGKDEGLDEFVGFGIFVGDFINDLDEDVFGRFLGVDVGDVDFGIFKV